MDAWVEVIRRFDEPPRFEDDGSWSVVLEHSMNSLGRVLRGAPGDFVDEGITRAPLAGPYGEGIGIEWEAGVLTNRRERALVTWSEHWQAGLSVNLTVFPSPEALETARQAALADLAESDEDARY